MTISQISINQSAFNSRQVSHSANSTQRKTSTMQRITTTRNNQTEQLAAKKAHIDFTKIQENNSDLNSIATNIHAADKTMEAIENKINKMHEKLETHVKNYPPFLPGSEERVKLLKSFRSFRKQIDKMTIPPKDVHAMKIMANPSVHPEACDWEIAFGDDGPHKTIHSKEVHTGPTGLDIPELPEGATDDDIKGAISGIRNAKAILKRARAELSQDTSDIAQLKGNIIQPNHMTESAAEAVSKDAKHALAGRFDESLTKTPSQFTHLLE